MNFRSSLLLMLLALVSPSVLAQTTSDRTPLSRQWQQHLTGQRLTQIEQSSNSGGGGYGGEMRRSDLFLCSNGQFMAVHSHNVNYQLGAASASGGTAGSGQNTEQGFWRIVEETNTQAAYLEVIISGQKAYLPLSYTNNQTFVSGQRTYVTNENSYCR